jgi:hypothetical protein
MYKDYCYVSGILRSWHIPACGLLAIATHWLVESLVQTGSHKMAFVLGSFFLSPLIISTIVRSRKVMWGAIINGAYLILSYSAFIFERGWGAAKRDFPIFLLVLTFGLVCGACAGGFHGRLSRRFGKAI